METDTPTAQRYRRLETHPLATFAVRAEARRQERLTPAEFRLLHASTALFARRAMIRADLDAVRLFRGQQLEHRHAHAIYFPGAKRVEQLLSHDMRMHRTVWHRCLRELRAAEQAVLAERGALRLAAE